MLENLIRLLDLHDNDYWYDEACNEARQIIDSAPEAIFALILKEWHDWPEERQQHLIYVLGEGNSPLEAQLIVEMLESDNMEIASLAKEAQRNLKRHH